MPTATVTARHRDRPEFQIEVRLDASPAAAQSISSDFGEPAPLIMTSGRQPHPSCTPAEAACYSGISYALGKLEATSAVVLRGLSGTVDEGFFDGFAIAAAVAVATAFNQESALFLHRGRWEVQEKKIA